MLQQEVLTSKCGIYNWFVASGVVNWGTCKVRNTHRGIKALAGGINLFTNVE